MKVNGKDTTLTAPLTVSEFLSGSGYDQNRIAVEINGMILPKSQYGIKILSDKDTIEIVTFMGGG